MSQSGPVALVGSGEYLPSMAEIEASLLVGRAPRYVQIATAAVPDGPDVVARWERLGVEQAQRLGVEPVTLHVESRADAADPSVVSQVAGAGLIYLSGGNPTFLADTLRDTPLWSAILETWGAGAALAGCSAGAMVMASWVPTIRHPQRGGTEGLAVLPHIRVIPHFDAFFSKVPDIAARFLVGRDDRVTVVGVDEETALVGGPENWTVQGRGRAWVLHGSARHGFAAGESVVTPREGSGS